MSKIKTECHDEIAEGFNGPGKKKKKKTIVVPAGFSEKDILIAKNIALRIDLIDLEERLSRNPQHINQQVQYVKDTIEENEEIIKKL